MEDDVLLYDIRQTAMKFLYVVSEDQTPVEKKHCLMSSMLRVRMRMTDKRYMVDTPTMSK